MRSLTVLSYSAPTGGFVEAIAETQRVWEKWDFSMTWHFLSKYGLMQLHFDKTSVCVIQEYMKSWGFFFFFFFAFLLQATSGQQHTSLSLISTSTEWQTTTNVSNRHPDRVSAVNTLQQRERPSLNLVFSMLRGTRGKHRATLPQRSQSSRSEAPADVCNGRDHLQDPFFIQMNHFWL